MLTYNQISDECFNFCVLSFNTRSLLKEEASCVDHCIQRYTNSRTRASRTFADIQYKKMSGTEIVEQKEAERKPLGQGPFSRLL